MYSGLDSLDCKSKPPPLAVVRQLTNWRGFRLCLNLVFSTHDHRQRPVAAVSPLPGGSVKPPVLPVVVYSVGLMLRDGLNSWKMNQR